MHLLVRVLHLYLHLRLLLPVLLILRVLLLTRTCSCWQTHNPVRGGCVLLLLALLCVPRSGVSMLR